MTYTLSEIKDAIKRETGGYIEDFWTQLEWNTAKRENLALTLHGERVPVEVVDSKYGEEGDWASQTYVVIRVGEQFFKMNGYYRSHDGEYWDGPFQEVMPVPRTAIDYRPI